MPRLSPDKGNGKVGAHHITAQAAPTGSPLDRHHGWISIRIQLIARNEYPLGAEGDANATAFAPFGLNNRPDLPACFPFQCGLLNCGHFSPSFSRVLRSISRAIFRLYKGKSSPEADPQELDKIQISDERIDSLNPAISYFRRTSYQSIDI
jgi:hypothetical protein